MGFKWKQSTKSKDLTVVMAVGNPIDTFQPFVEAFVSALPLGCNFLIGDFGSHDGTIDVIKTLSLYAKVDILKCKSLNVDNHILELVAISELVKKCDTKYALMLQTNDLLCEDCYDTILNNDGRSIFNVYGIDGKNKEFRIIKRDNQEPNCDKIAGTIVKCIPSMCNIKQLPFWAQHLKRSYDLRRSLAIVNQIVNC